MTANHKHLQYSLILLLALSLFTIQVHAGEFAPASPDAFYHAAVWGNDLDAAVGRAQITTKPILIFFTAPDCAACEHIKAFILKQERLQPTLRKFECVAINLAGQPELIPLAQINAVPSFIVLTSYGKIIGRFNGNISAGELDRTLAKLLSEDVIIRDIDILVQRLKTGQASISDWKEALLAMQKTDARKKITAMVWNLSRSDLDILITCLTDDLLAIRLGALEILEEQADIVSGMDPWIAPKSDDRQAAVTYWLKWRESNAGAPPEPHNMDKVQFERYLQDLISSEDTEDSRSRSENALRNLARGGEAVAKWIADYLQNDPNLNEHARRKINEVWYALTIPANAGNDPLTLAHNLVWGNQDVRVRTIFQLSGLGRTISPILTDLLTSPEPEIREAAIESLFVAAGFYAVKPAKKHLSREKDPDIIFLILKHMSDIKSIESQATLESYFTHDNEDIAIAAIEGAVNLSIGSLEEKLLPLIDDPRWRVKVAVLNALQKKGGVESGFIRKLRGKELLVSDRVAEAIYKCLDDEDAYVRHTAAATVGRLKLSNAESPLKKAYKKHPDMRGMVVSIFLELSISVPRAYIQDLLGPDPGDLLFVLDNIKKVTSDTRDLIYHAAKSDNPDIACTALRVLANNKNRVPGDNAILIDALHSSITEKQLTVIQEFDTSSEERVSLINMMKKIMQPAKEQDASSNTSNKEILHAIAQLMADKTVSDIVRTDAMIALCRYGYLAALEKAETEWETLTPSNRTMVVKTFNNFGKRAIPLFNKALADDNAKVWEEAVDLVNNKEGRVFIEPLTRQLLKKSSRLRMSAIWEAGIDDIVAADPKAFMAFASRVLQSAPDHPPDRVIFALVVYTYGGIPEAENDIVWELVKHGDPYIRRMAWIALYQKNKNFSDRTDTIMADESKYVRELIPSMMYNISYQRELDLYFSEDEFFSKYSGLRLREKEKAYNEADNRKLSQAAVKILEAMIDNDPADRIKYQCMITLLSHRIPCDLNKAVAIGRRATGTVAIANITTNLFNDHHYNLGKNFAVLLPLMDNRKGKAYMEWGVEDFRKRWGLTMEAIDEYRVGVSSPLMAEFTDPYDENTYYPGNLMQVKMVVFTTAGCRRCAAAEGVLEILRRYAPGIQVTRYDIHSTSGMIHNEMLCRRFNVNPKYRAVVPAVFVVNGYLIGEEIIYPALQELMKWSIVETGEVDLFEINDKASAVSSAVSERGLSTSWFNIAASGFSQGISPHFLAALVFLFNYLVFAKLKGKKFLRPAGIYLITIICTTLSMWFFLFHFFQNPVYLNQLGSIIIVILTITMFFMGIRFFFKALGHLRKKDKKPKKTHLPPAYSHVLYVSIFWGVVVSVLDLASLGDANTTTTIYLIKSRTALFQPVLMLLTYIISLVLPATGILAIYATATRNEKLSTFIGNHPVSLKLGASALWFYLFIKFIPFI